MKKKSTMVLLPIILMSMGILTGCEYEETGETVENATSSVISKDGSVKESDEIEKKTVSVNHNVNIDGKTVPVITSYGIDEKRLNDWKYTYSSVINLELREGEVDSSVSSKYSMKVNNVYSDISIIGSTTKTNGIRQDSLNISYNSLPSGGVDFSSVNKFTIPFQVEGINQNETAFYMYNGYGSSSTSRITESDLKEDGALGAKLNVVWSILITDNESGKSYMQTVTDKVGLPSKIAKQDK